MENIDWLFLGASRVAKFLQTLLLTSKNAMHSSFMTASRNSKSCPFDVTNPSFNHITQYQIKYLFISIPPIKEQAYECWKNIGHHLNSNVEKVIFISSTSVYKDTTRELNTPHPLISAEQALKDSFKDVLILRPSGLFDYDSHPVFSIAKKSEFTCGESEVINLVHREDLARAVLFLLTHTGVFDISHPYHPLKSEYYLQKILDFNLQTTVKFNLTKKSAKLIDSTVLNNMGFKYIHSP